MDTPQAEYLSREAHDRICYHSQGWGVLGLDTSTHAAGQTPLKLRIKDIEYARGLGTHAPADTLIELDGQYLSFEAEVGVQWQGANRNCEGTVVFQVYTDGEKRFDSGVMRESESAKSVSIPLIGAHELRLVALDAGDGICCDCANWAEARLIRDPKAAATVAEDTFEVGRFARVVTCDPHRVDGARSSRVEEFRAEDVFLETDLRPDPDGAYTIPRALDGMGAIGLLWTERRMLTRLELDFAADAARPTVEGVQVQCWEGESPWQGDWKPIAGEIEAADGRWILRPDLKQNPALRAGVRKIRWVFPAVAGAVRVTRPAAFTQSRWEAVEVVLELEAPRPGERGEVEVYNGEIRPRTDATGRDAPDSDAADRVRMGTQCEWGLGAPLKLQVRYSRPRPLKYDRTVLRFRLPDAAGGTTAFAVGMDDLLREKRLYLPHAKLLVRLASEAVDFAALRREVAGRRTLREQVHDLPDQTLAQAWQKVHNPVQRNGPTMVSLACDNRKFIVQREGAIEFSTVPDIPDPLLYYPQRFPCLLRPDFGNGDLSNLSRHLDGDWTPIPVTTVRQGEVVYSGRTFVAPADEQPLVAPGWLGRKPLCVAEFTIENTGDTETEARLGLSCLADVEKREAAQVQIMPRGAVLHNGSQVLAVVDTTSALPLAMEVGDGALTLRGLLPAKATARCVTYLPGWFVAPRDQAQLKGADELLARTRAYWESIIASGMQVKVPDKLLSDTIKASVVACYIAARNEADGARVSPWIAANVYGPLESEANTIIRGMDLLGHHEFARRALDFFNARISPSGYLTTGYTLIGTGWELHSLGIHYALTHDREWLTGAASKIASACRWIARQRDMTRGVDADLRKLPEFGLVPPGVTADWDLYTYRFFNQAFYCAGLREAALALKDLGHPDADALLAAAEDFRREIHRAYSWAQGRVPAEQLSTGAWIPAPPTMLESPGKVADYYPGADGARSWASDVEIGPHHLAALEVFAPNDPEVTRMLDLLEDYWFLQSGMGDYAEERNRADWFSLGGFAKVQPYYGRTAELYALRDEVKPFIRAYFNALPSLLNPENMTFWEHFHNMGAWNKTHETGSFLSQTRMMFAVEHGEELWLAPCVTSNWLQDGQTVSVRNAPTRFGPVSYSITSHEKEGFIEATVEPPTRTPPQAIVLRIRHPEGKRMQSVTVNGQRQTDFDGEREIVRLKAEGGEVRVEY